MAEKQLFISIIAIVLMFNYLQAVPIAQNDIDAPFGLGSGGIGSFGANSNVPAVDYNTVVGHFKDFFMYFPVIMTSLKETMTGFPKLAEGIRILTSKKGRLDDDCKCDQNYDNNYNSNELENSSRYG